MIPRVHPAGNGLLRPHQHCRPLCPRRRPRQVSISLPPSPRPRQLWRPQEPLFCLHAGLRRWNRLLRRARSRQRSQQPQDWLHPGQTPAPTENPDQRITVGTAATEAPPFLRWQIGSEDSTQDREIAAATAQCVFEYLDSLGLPEISDHITLNMYEDFETVVETYSIQAGQSNSFSRDFWKEQVAVSWADWAIINLSNAAVDGSIQDVPLLTFHIANTFTRSILYHVSELPPGASEGQVPQMGPYWLYLGINYYLREQAISTAGFVQYEEIREISHVVQANLVERPLRGMETREGFVGEDRTGHRVGLLAAELLSSYSGQSSLVRYFAFLQPGIPWQEAFESAFGLTVEEFYDRFEAHRAAGFPVVDAPIDAPFHVERTTLLGENDPPAQGSVVFSDDFFELVTDLTAGGVSKTGISFWKAVRPARRLTT